AFLGLVVGHATTWLRDWPLHQRFASPDSDEVVTTYANPRLRLRVTVWDVAARGHDVLARRVEVHALPGAPARPTALMAFENFNLVFGKAPGLPGQDWCTEQLEGDTAVYDPGADAIVHSTSGVDESTGRPSSVSV